MRIGVEVFANRMECKLLTKDNEHGIEGWLDDDCNIKFLYDRLIQEVAEAKKAIDDCNPDNLANECVDIANFAMMIADKIRIR